MQKEGIDNIRLSIGVIVIPGHKSTKNDNQLRESGYKLKAREKALIEKSMASISDPELGRIVERAMKKEIIRRRLTEDGKFH